jgi:hypothetical protein
MRQLENHWTESHGVRYWRSSAQSVELLQFRISSEEKKETSARGPARVSDRISNLSRLHIFLNNFFLAQTLLNKMKYTFYIRHNFSEVRRVSS